MSTATHGFPRRLPRSKTGRQKLLADLAVWRKKSLERLERLVALRRRIDWSEEMPPLLLGERYTDTLPAWPVRWPPDVMYGTPCSLPGNCPHPGPPPARPRPAAFSSGIYDTVYFAGALKVAPGYAQVYHGTLGPRDDPGAAPVVVKIYQASLRSPKSWESCLSRQSNPWQSALHEFRVENWAYERLRPLQGSLVPHVYGFFEVMLPHGEPSIALVMEHIQGVQARKVVLPQGRESGEMMATVAHSLLFALHAVHACGVGWLDMAERNILFYNSQPDYPVFFDFALSRGVNEVLLPSQIPSIFQILLSMRFDEDECEQWLSRRIVEPQMRALFNSTAKESLARRLIRRQLL